MATDVTISFESDVKAGVRVTLHHPDGTIEDLSYSSKNPLKQLADGDYHVSLAGTALAKQAAIKTIIATANAEKVRWRWTTKQGTISALPGFTLPLASST